MHYICIENNDIIGIMEYEPNVPNTVEVYEISDDERKSLDVTHYFDVKLRKIQPLPQQYFDKIAQDQQNAVYRKYLSDTDWMIMRHLRELSLGVTTSLTEQEFLALESKRAETAAKITG